MGMAGIFVTFDEVLWLLAINEVRLRRMVSEGDMRAFRNGDQMKFRLIDACNARTAEMEPPPCDQPTVQSFGLQTAAQRIGITDEQLMAAVSWKLVPFGRTNRVTMETPEEWLAFWAKERTLNTDRWRDFLATIAKPLSATKHPCCVHGRVIGVTPCSQCAEMAEAEKDEQEIVGSSDGDGIRPTGCCLAIALFAMKIGSGALIGAALASTLLA